MVFFFLLQGFGEAPLKSLRGFCSSWREGPPVKVWSRSGEQRSRRRRQERDRAEERQALGNFAIKVGAQAYIFP